MAQSSLFLGIVETEDEIKDQLSDCQDWKCNKIGGYPVFSPKCKTDIIKDIKSLVCDSCQHMLTFVLQIYCPIDDSPNDRILYIFVCINTECRQNKWIALRSVTTSFHCKCAKQPESFEQKNVWIESETDWDQDWDDSHEDHKQTEESTSHQSVNCRQQSDKCQIISDQSLAYFRPFYVSVIDEPLEDKSEDKHIKQLIESYECEKNKLNSDKSGNSGSETYEQNYMHTIYGNDRKTYKFFKRLSRCPQQIIRYNWEGIPLLNSDNCQPTVLKCDLCASDRSFELQLMPALIAHLKPLPGKQNVDLDFGTVLIYTCSKNCNKMLNSFSIEQCIVLSDPDNELIKQNKDLNKK